MLLNLFVLDKHSNVNNKNQQIHSQQRNGLDQNTCALFRPFQGVAKGSKQDKKKATMDLLNFVYKYFRKKLDDDTENSRTMSNNGEEQEIKAGSQDKEYFQ